MDFVNLEKAYDYLDGLTDHRERSAALAVHLSCMDHPGAACDMDSLVADAPIDLWLFYRSAVAAFGSPLIHKLQQYWWTAGRVINRDQALRRLAIIPPGPLFGHALRFTDEAVKLSGDSPCEQDLLFLLRFFLMVVERCTIEAIASGEISKASRRLDDPDYW